MPNLPAAELEAFAERILTASGMTAGDAAAAAANIVYANLRGVDSHGVVRLVQYSESLRGGEVEPRPEVEVVWQENACALVDAGGGYGFVPGRRAAELAAEAAGRFGIGVAGVRRSHHFGMAAAYAEHVARKGSIGIVATNADTVLAPPGALRAVVGNNPLAIAVPRRPPAAPLIVDMAMSESAFGKIRLAAAEGRPIPEGWAQDAAGRPTTDAAIALEAGMLAPMGGHKGFALAVVLEALTGILTGSPFGSAASAHRHAKGGVGHLVIALRPDLFVAGERFYTDLERWLAEVLATPVADGRPALVLPGDPERRQEAARRRDGIPVSEALLGRLQALAGELGVAPLPQLAPQAIEGESK